MPSPPEESAVIVPHGKRSPTTVAVTAAIGAIVGAVVVALVVRHGDPTISHTANASPADVQWNARPDPPNVDYLLNLRTGTRTPLPDSLVVSAVEFGRFPGMKYAASPDGSKLAYVGLGDDDNPQIFVARTDGGAIRQLTHDVREAMSPAWSPDGRMIAYAGYGMTWSGNRRSLLVVDVATGKTRRLATGSGEAWGPQFTPDGSSVLYTGGPGYAPVLRVAPLAGGRSTVFVALTRGLTDTGNGALSPDGSLVTFLGGGWPQEAGHHCGPCRLLARADGTERRVLEGECWVLSPAGAWSPDGRRLVCSNDRNGIVVVDVATAAASHVAEGQAAIWLDAQTLLVDVA